MNSPNIFFSLLSKVVFIFSTVKGPQIPPSNIRAREGDIFTSNFACAENFFFSSFSGM